MLVAANYTALGQPVDANSVLDSIMSPLAAMAEEVRAFFNQRRVLCGGILVVCAGVAVHRWVKRRKTQNKRKAYPRDTVILHDIGRGPYAPSAVPATVKLETYLRMAKIPYQYEFSLESSSKQKWPWVTFNGEDVADSAFIIQFLNRRYDLDLSAWLSAEQRSVAVAFQRLAEESLYWVLAVTRWVNEAHLEFLQKILGGRLSGLYIKMAMMRYIRNMAWSQGIGRHSHQEVKEIARKDLTALSNYLGRKKFLMGDQPCEEDCAVFGQLAQLYWHLPGSVSAMLKEEFPLLVAYCERMKDTFWPDWLQCTTQGGTVTATR